jgi:hypothetical protein
MTRVFNAGVAVEIFSKDFKATLPPARHVIAVDFLLFLFLFVPLKFFFVVFVQAIFLLVL